MSMSLPATAAPAAVAATGSTATGSGATATAEGGGALAAVFAEVLGALLDAETPTATAAVPVEAVEATDAAELLVAAEGLAGGADVALEGPAEEIPASEAADTGSQSTEPVMWHAGLPIHLTLVATHSTRSAAARSGLEAVGATPATPATPAIPAAGLGGPATPAQPATPAAPGQGATARAAAPGTDRAVPGLPVGAAADQATTVAATAGPATADPATADQATADGAPTDLPATDPAAGDPVATDLPTADLPVADAEPTAPVPTATATSARTEVAEVATAETADAPRPTAPPPGDQIASAVAALRRRGDGSYTASIDLHPAELGSVHVDLEVHGGVVNVLLVPAQESTRALLADQIAQLRADLQQAGLDAGSLDVATGGQQDRREGDRPDRTPTRSPAEEQLALRPLPLPRAREHRTDTSVDLRV